MFSPLRVGSVGVMSSSSVCPLASVEIARGFYLDWGEGREAQLDSPPRSTVPRSPLLVIPR